MGRFRFFQVRPAAPGSGTCAGWLRGRAEVIKRLGPSSAEYALPSSERLQYSRQPAGIQVCKPGKWLTTDEPLPDNRDPSR